MLKRISAAVLIISMLAVTSAITPVMAVSTCLTDDFENAADNISTANANYYYVSDNGLLIRPKYSMWSEHISIAENKGYGDALYIHCDKTRTSAQDKIRGAALMTKGILLTDKDETAGTEEKAIVLRYKINIEYCNDTVKPELIRLSGISTEDNDDPKQKSAAFLVMKQNEKMCFVNNDGGTPYEFSNNKWYTVVTKVSGAGAVKSIKAYIIDENNNIVISVSDTVSSDYIIANKDVYLWPAYTPNTTIATDQESLVKYYIDDVSLTEYTTNQNVSIDLANTNIVNNETDVAINKSFNVSFDQEIAAVESGAVLLYKTNDINKTPVSITVSNETFNGFTVKPDTNLDPNTSYTLDFSGITNSSKVAIDEADTITFTTVDPNKIPVKFESAKTSSGAVFTDGTLANVALDESFVLNFDSAIIAPAANTDIKMYLNNADKTAVSVSVKLSNDKKSVTITPAATLSLATGYVIDFSGVLSDTYGELEGTSSLSFTTLQRREMLYYEDDVETANAGALSNYESDVFSVASSSILSVEEKAGYNNSKGIRIVSDKAHKGIQTKSFPFDTSERVILEYKINVAEASGEVKPSTDAEHNSEGLTYALGGLFVNGYAWNQTGLEIKADKYGYLRIGSYSTSYPYYFEKNVWYTIICEVSKTTQNIYLFDEKGKLVYDCSYSRVIDGETVHFYPIFGWVRGYLDAVIDDVKIYRLSDHELGLEPTKSDVSADGMTNLIVDDKITLAFNQPLNVANKDVADTFELWENGTKVSATAKKLDANTIVITPEKMLKDATDYTVKISALSALSGNDAENAKEIKFTTKDLYSVKATSASLDITSGTISAGSATLSIQNSGSAIEGAVIVAAIYDGGRPGKLVKIKVFENMDITAGANTKSLEFNEDVSGVGSVEFFLYNSITSPKPLMRAYKITR